MKATYRIIGKIVKVLEKWIKIFGKGSWSGLIVLFIQVTDNIALVIQTQLTLADHITSSYSISYTDSVH
jgi:hypothetical protein